MARFLTTFQAAALLGVSPATVVNWADDGRLPCHRTPGGHRRVAEEALRAFAVAYGLPIVERPPVGPARVLVVDDDEDYLHTLATLLTRKGGYAVRSASSGFDAGQAVERFRPQAILMDVRMPGLDGFAVTDALRKGGSRIPVIGCTAYADEETWQRMLAVFDAAFQKPVELDRLLQTLRGLLERSSAPLGAHGRGGRG